ncbi:unnamed protein product [Acidithrix sp. C25]|nr:unnamed protein product [Acidithrix sp. C25]
MTVERNQCNVATPPFLKTWGDLDAALREFSIAEAVVPAAGGCISGGLCV